MHLLINGTKHVLERLREASINLRIITQLIGKWFSNQSLPWLQIPENDNTAPIRRSMWHKCLSEGNVFIPLELNFMAAKRTSPSVPSAAADLQGCTKRWSPGCVSLDEKVAFCLPTTGRRTQLFQPTFLQRGKSLLEIPCILFVWRKKDVRRGEEKWSKSSSTDRTIQFSNLLLRLPIPTDASSFGVRGPQR